MKISFLNKQLVKIIFSISNNRFYTHSSYLPKCLNYSNGKNHNLNNYYEIKNVSSVATNQHSPLIKSLTDVLKLQNTKVSSWIIENHVKTLCFDYEDSDFEGKNIFLLELASLYSIDHKEVVALVNPLLKNQCEDHIIKISEKFIDLLTPKYKWIFFHIGKLENGVKFLVKLRIDVLDILKKMDSTDPLTLKMQKLNHTLKTLLSLWFSVGFLDLQRITWHTSCDMLQKISEYEAVHPVRSWAELKRRVGPYRRCFVYTHKSMPDEPLVVLHTALTENISNNVPSITNDDRLLNSSLKSSVSTEREDPSKIKAAMFYSISSTQKGLHGIELGNYLIKRVVQEILTEYPHIDQFSTLSPIPNFRNWLYLQFKNEDKNNLFNNFEVAELQKLLGVSNIFPELKKRLNTNAWLDDSVLARALEKPLMRLCVQYLYNEKRRGYALDNVANFHLKNGAVMWRLNWMADKTPRGVGYSCGMMVNYRYFMKDAENNSRAYIEKQAIFASPLILNILKQH